MRVWRQVKADGSGVVVFYPASADWDAWEESLARSEMSAERVRLRTSNSGQGPAAPCASSRLSLVVESEAGEDGLDVFGRRVEDGPSHPEPTAPTPVPCPPV